MGIGRGLTDNDLCTISMLEEVALIFPSQIHPSGLCLGAQIWYPHQLGLAYCSWVSKRCVLIAHAIRLIYLTFLTVISFFDLSRALLLRLLVPCRAVISLQPFWKIWTGQLHERDNGYCECPTHSGLHSHHHGVHLPTRVPRPDSRIFNCQRSIDIHNWTTPVDRFVSV